MADPMGMTREELLRKLYGLSAPETGLHGYAPGVLEAERQAAEDYAEKYRQEKLAEQRKEQERAAAAVGITLEPTPAPSQRLATEFSAPAPTLPPKSEVTPEDLKQAQEYAQEYIEKHTINKPPRTPAYPGEQISEEPEGPAAAPVAQGVRPSSSDFFNRYWQASENERQALLREGYEKDIAEAMSTALQTPAHLRAGVSGPKWTAPGAAARRMAATQEKTDLEALEMLDPSSSRSRHMQEFVKTQFPELMDPTGMSASQIVQMMPFIQQAEDREWKRKTYEQRQRRQDLRDELAIKSDIRAEESAKFTRMDRDRRWNLVDKATASQWSANYSTIDNISALRNLIEESDITGPVTGRLNLFFSDVGINEPEVFASSQRMVNLLATYVLGKSGRQVSDKERKFLSKVTPQMFQSKEGFLTILEGFQDIIEEEQLNNFQIQYDMGKDVSRHYNTFMQKLGKAPGQPMYSKSAYNGPTIDVVWPEDGSVTTIKDTPEAREAARAAGYQVPGE